MATRKQVLDAKGKCNWRILYIPSTWSCTPVRHKLWAQLVAFHSSWAPSGTSSTLNLSGTGFLGTVPHQLGNLSRLQYLDLSRMSDTNSLDVSWLTRLPFLKYLDLSYLGPSTVTGWPHVVLIPFSEDSWPFLLLIACKCKSIAPTPKP